VLVIPCPHAALSYSQLNIGFAANNWQCGVFVPNTTFRLSQKRQDGSRCNAKEFILVYISDRDGLADGSTCHA
jgi:hypothetical protein